ncbi:MAG: hypothetical protein L7T80_09230 [Arenicellales bacterium]|nr:hypothetical protein [Arenicellales bacterium]
MPEEMMISEEMMIPVFVIGGMAGAAVLVGKLSQKGGAIGQFVRGYPNASFSLTLAAGGIAGAVVHQVVFY